MPAEVDLWQKSLCPVRQITVFFAVVCDSYHVPACESALRREGLKPYAGDMPNQSIPLSRVLPAAGLSQKAGTPSFQLRPMQVTWEMTRACDWKASHARVAARPVRDKREFSTAEAFHLIEEVADMHVPLLVLTGGDPLLRPDLFPIVDFAARHSVRTSLTLLPTPLLDAEVIGELKARGLMRVAFWLHGSTAALDDAYWGVQGCHRRTLDTVGACHEVDLPVQINTIMAQRNVHDVDLMIELLTRLDVALWNVIFLVPAGREQAQEMLTAEEHEAVFAKLYEASQRVHFQIKTSEGQHYQRYLLQQRARESSGRMTEVDVITCAPKGVNDGKYFVFIDPTGEVYPSRYLPLSGGNVTAQPLAKLYCESPLFVSLRDSSKLKGKCGRCPARNVCGGSRARAYSMTGDMFAEDPSCSYEPQANN